MNDTLKASHSAAEQAPSCASLLKVLADDIGWRSWNSCWPGPKHVGEINETLGVEQSLLSHHPSGFASTSPAEDAPP